MIDTFRPLKLTKQALGAEDSEYMFSWRPEIYTEIGSNGATE